MLPTSNVYAKMYPYPYGRPRSNTNAKPVSLSRKLARHAPTTAVALVGLAVFGMLYLTTKVSGVWTVPRSAAHHRSDSLSGSTALVPFVASSATPVPTLLRNADTTPHSVALARRRVLNMKYEKTKRRDVASAITHAAALDTALGTASGTVSGTDAVTSGTGIVSGTGTGTATAAGSEQAQGQGQGQSKTQPQSQTQTQTQTKTKTLHRLPNDAEGPGPGPRPRPRPRPIKYYLRRSQYSAVA